jgi:hypothetical protein
MMFNDDHDCRHAKCLNARHLHDNHLAIICIHASRAFHPPLSIGGSQRMSMRMIVYVSPPPWLGKSSPPPDSNRRQSASASPTWKALHARSFNYPQNYEDNDKNNATLQAWLIRPAWPGQFCTVAKFCKVTTRKLT